MSRVARDCGCIAGHNKVQGIAFFRSPDVKKATTPRPGLQTEHDSDSCPQPGGEVGPHATETCSGPILKISVFHLGSKDCCSFFFSCSAAPFSSRSQTSVCCSGIGTAKNLSPLHASISTGHRPFLIWVSFSVSICDIRYPFATLCLRRRVPSSLVQESSSEVKRDGLLRKRVLTGLELQAECGPRVPHSQDCKRSLAVISREQIRFGVYSQRRDISDCRAS